MKLHKISFLFLLVFLHFFSFGQYKFKAVVQDSVSMEKLTGASVLAKGTLNGGTTDSEGIVSLNFAKTGRYDLQISFIGYETKIVKIEIPQKDSAVQIMLKPIDTEISEITVTSFRTNSTIENIPTKIELLGLDDLNEENSIKPGNILSLLGDIAGIQMQQISASTGNVFARIQGLNGRYTQILKDGLPLFGGMSGSFSLLQIPPLDLKQIEIIKGCGSTLYGADAIGGIINLVSKEPLKKQELSMTANQTSLLESNLNLYAAKKYGKFGYTFFLGGTRQKQSDIDRDGLTDVPFVRNIVIHPKFNFYFNPKSTLTVNYTGTFENRLGGLNSYFINRQNDYYHVKNLSQRHSSDMKWLYNASEKLQLTFKMSHSLLDENLNTKDVDFRAIQNIYFSEFSVSGHSKTGQWVVGLNLNGDIFRNKNTVFENITDYNFSTKGIFIQNTLNLTGKFIIESGFREDLHSKYGLFHLPRIAFMYKVNKNVTCRLNGGLGYKIPVPLSYLDIESDLTKKISVDLKPELSQGVNSDFNFQFPVNQNTSITFNQAFFYTNISKPIYNLSGNQLEVILVNADKPLTTSGLQTYSRLNCNNLEIYLGYVFTHTVQNYSPAHKTPLATPKHQVSTTAFYDFSDHLVFGLESSYIGNQIDQDFKKTKNYFILAAMLQYKLKNLTFVLNGENLLDFRQSRYGRIYEGTIQNPVFHRLWAPIDGRVINLSVKWQIF